MQKAAKAQANQMVWAAQYKKLKNKKSTQDTTATTTTVTTTGTSQRKPKSTAPTIITRPQKPATTAVIPTTNKTATITTGDSSPTVVTRGVKPKGITKKVTQTNVTNIAGAITPVVSTSAGKVKTDPTTPPNTRIRAKQKAIIQLLETIPEDLLSRL